MAAPTPALPPPPQPLGLPRGSVRATLALALSATFWYLVLRGQTPVEPLLLDAVLLVVAFYFGVRSTTPVAPAQTSPATWQPLFLPRGSVRSVLLLGFLGIIVFTWYRDRTVDANLLLIGQVLGSYVTGFAVSALMANRLRSAKGPSATLALFRHALAAFAIGVTGVVCWSIVFGTPVLPALSRNVLSWTVAFYFGSRLAP